MNKLSKDVILSTIFAILNILFSFWLINKAEFAYSIIHLGVFMYIRRIGPTFSNFVQLGNSQALIRFASINKDNRQKIKVYYTISYFIWFVISAILLFTFYLFNVRIGSYLFPDIEQSESVDYVRIILVYINVLHLSYIVLSYFLSRRKILLYNTIQLISASLVFLIVLVYFGKKVDIINLFDYSFVIMYGVLLVASIYIIVKTNLLVMPSFSIIKKEGGTFVNYGLPRALITFLDMFILTLGAMMIKDQRIIGGFLIGITLSRAILVVLQPVSLLSAVISGHVNTEQRHKKIVNLLVGGTLYLAIIADILLYNWIDVLLPFWLKNNETIHMVVRVFKVLSIGVIPYAMFQALKGITEIKFIKPLNLYSLLIAISIHIVVYYSFSYFLESVFALSLSLTLSFITLGGLSLFWNRRYLNKHQYFSLAHFIVLSIFLFTINYAVHYYYSNLIGFFIGTALTGIIALIFVFKVKIVFIEESLILFKLKQYK